MVQALALNPVAPEVPVVALPNPGEKKTREKTRYKGKENIVYIIIQTCIRRDDACRSTVFIHMLGLREIILSLDRRGAGYYVILNGRWRTDVSDRHGVCPYIRRHPHQPNRCQFGR